VEIRKWAPEGVVVEHKKDFLSHHEGLKFKSCGHKASYVDANTTVVLTRLDGYDPERGVKIVG
jgi:seryl-tRNA synthetase